MTSIIIPTYQRKPTLRCWATYTSFEEIIRIAMDIYLLIEYIHRDDGIIASEYNARGNHMMFRQKEDDKTTVITSVRLGLNKMYICTKIMFRDRLKLPSELPSKLPSCPNDFRLEDIILTSTSYDQNIEGETTWTTAPGYAFAIVTDKGGHYNGLTLLKDLSKKG